MKHGSKYVLVMRLLFFISENEANPCASRLYALDCQICVCNATYCDSVPTFTEQDLKNGQYVRYESNIGGKRFDLSKGNINAKYGWPSLLDQIQNIFTASHTVSPESTYQTILGFGGALSDSSAHLIASLSEDAQKLLLRQYFTNEGISYNLLKITIGASDYSLRMYTYDDVENDITLSHFNLTTEDYDLKIPFIKAIMDMSELPVKIIGTSWIAPQWMVEYRYIFLLPFFTKLKDQYYDVYAKYFIKYLDAYKEQGITLWGLSSQNEPTNGLFGILPPVNTGWWPWEQARFLCDFLGPQLHSNGYQDLNLLVMDDQRSHVLIWVFITMLFPNAWTYISGIAVHWYLNWVTGPSILDLAHILFPSLYIFPTEHSLMLFDNPVELGSWENAEVYANDVIENLNNWAVGWMDWNIALDPYGGPSFTGNTLEAPVIINVTANEFYKQPMFYALGHFSRFITPGSKRLGVSKWLNQGVKSAAFLTPSNNIVVILLNRSDIPVNTVIKTGTQGQIELNVAGRSIHTIIYKYKN